MAMAVAQRKTEVGRTHAERRREAETRIVQAAFDIVAKRGVDQLTLAEAGEEAGYSRALPAHYFGNRDVLLAAVAEHAVNQYRRRVVEKNLPTAAGLEPILTGIAFYLDDSRSWPKRLKAFHEVTNAALRWPLIAEVTAKLNREQVKRFAQQIRAAQALGEIRADIDPVAEAITVSGTIRGVMAQWLVAPDSIDLDAVRDGFIAGLRRNWAA
jgi:AcrR family transcriptional regulator